MEAHLNEQMIQNDVMDTARIEGRAEGLKEGEEKRNREVALSLLALGTMTDEQIASIANLSVQQVRELK